MGVDVVNLIAAFVNKAFQGVSYGDLGAPSPQSPPPEHKAFTKTSGKIGDTFDLGAMCTELFVPFCQKATKNQHIVCVVSVNTTIFGQRNS